MMTNSKDVLKEFNLALKHFRNAVKMAKKNLIIGEVNFQTAPKTVRTRKVKSPSLPDADTKGYMKERKEEETD
jgi:hypothetical protein